MILCLLTDSDVRIWWTFSESKTLIIGLYQLVGTREKYYTFFLRELFENVDKETRFYC